MARAVKKKPANKKVPSAKRKAAGKSAGKVAVGSRAPDFLLPATRLGLVSGASLRGKPFVLYFYPKDDTSGCTAEACGFRDSLSAFNRLGAVVIGISRDSLAQHEKFAAKYDLTFPLASDENSSTCERFGVWIKKSMYGRSYMGIERSTFLIDGKGVVRAVWRKVSVPGHVDDVKKALAAL